MVFWALCRQDCGPKLGSGYYFFGQRSDVELIFLNLLCQLYDADRHSRRLELLESEHRPDSPFYPAVVLLDYVVQVFRGANPYPARKRSNLTGENDSDEILTLDGLRSLSAIIPRERPLFSGVTSYRSCGIRGRRTPVSWLSKGVKIRRCFSHGLERAKTRCKSSRRGT